MQTSAAARVALRTEYLVLRTECFDRRESASLARRLKRCTSCSGRSTSYGALGSTTISAWYFVLGTSCLLRRPSAIGINRTVFRCSGLEIALGQRTQDGERRVVRKPSYVDEGPSAPFPVLGTL